MWILFAMNFEDCIAIGIAIADEIRVVVRIRGKLFRVRLVIWFIANAAPVLDFWKRISVMKETDITIVLIEPRRIRNCFLVVLPEISDAMIAAWLDPKPGKREQIGEIIIVAIVGFSRSFFGMFSFLIFCFGRTVFDFME